MEAPLGCYLMANELELTRGFLLVPQQGEILLTISFILVRTFLPIPSLISIFNLLLLPKFTFFLGEEA